MRKMTKTAAVLAAMSAMTVASASMAFAAIGEYSSTNVPAEDAAVVGAGKWAGSNDNGWTFTPDGGSKLKDTWAEIDGVYYYFEGDKALQDAVRFIDGATYYFDASGRMATGWQKITSKMDAYSDIELDEEKYYDDANEYVDVNDAYDYEDFVWCYFDEHGVAKENEWFQSPESGLWYYFEGNVMIKNIYNFTINPDNYDVTNSANTYLYGFDKNGAMLTGWNYSSRKDKGWNNPTAGDDGKTWYYYNSNGKMQTTGWKQIDGKWYLFADYRENTDGAKKVGHPLITNSYIHSDKKNGDTEFFYVDKNGAMQTGVTTIPKNAWGITFYNGSKDVNVDYEQDNVAKSGSIVVNLGSNGAAKEEVVGKRYYAMSYKDKLDEGVCKNIIKTTLAKETNSIVSANVEAVTTGGVYAVTGTAFKLTDPFVEGELVKNAFIAPEKNVLYLADDKGDFVSSKAVLIDAEAGIELNGATYDHAYILFGNNGKAYTGYTGEKKSITIGGTTYWATNYSFKLDGASATDVTVFVSNKTK